MATGWGVDPVLDADGVPTSGTSSQDVRRIWGGLYSPGIVNGCTIHTSSTNMTYTVDPGVAVIQTAGDYKDRQCILVPVPNTVVTASPNTSGSQRLDSVYVRQQIPGSTNDVVVEVAEGTDIPSNSQLIGQFTASANSSTTSRSYFTGSVPYSVPYGANLGLFFHRTDTSNSVIPKNTTTTIASGSFTLMTDRKCIVVADLNVSAMRPDGTRAYRFDNTAYTELLIEVHIDGKRSFVFNTPGLHQAWSTFHFEEYVNLKSGNHSITFKYVYSNSQGPGTVLRHFSGTNAATGCNFAIRDGGFWEGVV